MTTQLWTASVHLPGCLPDGDSLPAVFTDPTSAWDYLQDDRLLAFTNAEMDPGSTDDRALADITTMLNTPAHNQYGTVQGPDPVNPDFVLCYTVEPITIKDFLSNYTVASAMDAFRDRWGAYSEDPGFHRMDADEAHNLLCDKATEAEVYRAAHDAYVNLDLARTNATIDDVQLNTLVPFILAEPEYLNSPDEVLDTLIEILLEADLS